MRRHGALLTGGLFEGGRRVDAVVESEQAWLWGSPPGRAGWSAGGQAKVRESLGSDVGIREGGDELALRRL